MGKLKFVAFYGISFTSSVIRYFTRSRSYSHIAILVNNTKLIEAWPHEGSLKQWTDYSDISKHTPGTKYEVWSIEVDDKVYEDCMRFYNYQALNKTPYDYSGVFAFVFKKLMKNNANKFFCSELAIFPIVKALGWSSIKPHLVSPRDFVNLIEAAGGELEIKGIVDK